MIAKCIPDGSYINRCLACPNGTASAAPSLLHSATAPSSLAARSMLLVPTRRMLRRPQVTVLTNAQNSRPVTTGATCQNVVRADKLTSIPMALSGTAQLKGKHDHIHKIGRPQPRVSCTAAWDYSDHILSFFSNDAHLTASLLLSRSVPTSAASACLRHPFATSVEGVLRPSKLRFASRPVVHHGPRCQL